MVMSSIDGLSYMDPIIMKPPSPYPRGEDPCNPLYWYPKHIPEYCKYRNFPIPGIPIVPPLPMPLPVPAPFPVLSPLPYGLPIAPTNPMLPVAPPIMRSAYPYPASIYPSAQPANIPNPSNLRQIGMVPNLPGLVTRDGGINILPFSDAYADLIENHKRRMIRKRLQKLIHEYEDFPNARTYRRLRKYDE